MLRKWTISSKEQKRNFRPSLSFSYPQIAFGLENKAKLNEMLCICSGLFVGLIVKAIYSLIIHCILYILVTLRVDAEPKTMLYEEVQESTPLMIKKHLLLKRPVKTNQT